PAPFAPTIARSPIVRGLRPLSGAEALGELALPALHAPRLGGRALVVVAEEMQHPVDQQPIELVRQRRGALRRLPARGVDGDDDVAQESPRRATRTLALGEREHVGR